MSLRIAAACLIAALASLVAGCGRTPSAPAAMPQPINDATAQEPATNDDTGQGDGYTYRLRYPQVESAALASAMRTYGDRIKKDFLDARSGDTDADTPPFRLDLEFKVARRTSDFVSVSANGSSYIGGAHGNPLLASFNLHVDDDKLLGIEDLFADPPAALKALSDESRRQLEGRYDATPRESMTEKQRASDRQQMYAWIEKGTEPAAGNFKVFLVDGIDAKAIGLTLIFPPYQVASYADGPQQIEVPAKVFYALLKPEYRDAFIVDTEAPAQRAR